MEVWIQKARRMLELRQGRPRAAALPRRVGPGACRTQGAGRGWPYPGGNLLYLPCKGSGQIRQEFGTELSLPGGSGTGAGRRTDLTRRRGTPSARAWESRTRPPGARRWAGKSTCTRAALLPTGRRAASRWKQRTWPGFLSAGRKSIRCISCPEEFPKGFLEGFSCNSHRFCRAASSIEGPVVV